MPEKILLIDDEPDLLGILDRFFTRQGYLVHTADCGEAGWKCIAETMYDLVISDLAMENLNGIELLNRIRTIDTNLPFIIMTGAGSIESAVDAIKLGAYHYITKPFKPRDLGFLAKRAIEYGQLHRKLESYQKKDSEEETTDTMVIGSNKVIQEMMVTIEKISKSDASVLILGETGTGKSLYAKRIHEASNRADKPFYIIDCGALVEQLLESELFGHVKGAFTGAFRAKRGLLEEAQGGTIFLDEIAELSPSTQAKLLRAVKEHEIRPVGGNSPINIDVRFLAATNRNLDKEVSRGEFREDLYYRLAVIPLHLPPLRERKEDLVLFLDHFIRRANAKYHKNVHDLAFGAMQTMMDLPWKGNIRELENVIERAVLLADGNTITMNDIFTNSVAPADQLPASSGEPVTLRKVVEQAEVKAIHQALSITEGNRTQAAKVLGIARRTLYDKIEAYNI